MARLIRADNGPPFSSVAFKKFCDDSCIGLNLTAPYHPKSSGAAERGIGLIKALVKKNGDVGNNYEEAFEA